MLSSWVLRFYAFLSRLTPYAAVALLIPGGGIFLALVWMYRHRQGLCHAVSVWHGRLGARPPAPGPLSADTRAQSAQRLTCAEQRQRSRQSSLRPSRQPPLGPHKMAGVAIGIPLQIILMLGLGLPKVARGRDLRHYLPRPKTGCVDIRDGVLGNPPLLLGRIEDGGPIAKSAIVPLPVQRRRIMDLEEELKELAIAD